MPRYWIVRRVGSLPSCYRWYGFDAEAPERGPQTISHHTRTRTVEILRESGAVVLTERQLAALPLYVKMREMGEMTLTREEEAQVMLLRGIAKAEGLTLVQSREKDPHWSRRQGPLRVAAVIPGSGGVIARFDRGVRDVEPTGGLL